jgi:hypothetical protein
MFQKNFVQIHPILVYTKKSLGTCKVWWPDLSLQTFAVKRNRFIIRLDSSLLIERAESIFGSKFAVVMKKRHPKVGETSIHCRNEDSVNAVIPNMSNVDFNFGRRNNLLLRVNNRGIDFIYEPSDATLRVACRFNTFRATDAAISSYVLPFLSNQETLDDEPLFRIGDTFIVDGTLFEVVELVPPHYLCHSVRNHNIVLHLGQLELESIFRHQSA